jgi:tetratricopeptide (TPR) repeat protein
MPVTEIPETSPTPTFSPTPELSLPNSSTETGEGISPVQPEQQTFPTILWVLSGSLGISLLLLLIVIILLVRLKKRADSSKDEVMDTIMAAEYKTLGDFATEKGNLPLARKCYRKVAQLETQPDNPYKIGLAYFQAEQYEEAITELNKCLQDDVLKPRAYFYLAYSCLNLERWEQAEEYFKEAMQLNPNDPYIFVGLGFIAQSRQQYGQAKQYYKKALQIEPTCQEAQENLYQIRDY